MSMAPCRDGGLPPRARLPRQRWVERYAIRENLMLALSVAACLALTAGLLGA